MVADWSREVTTAVTDSLVGVINYIPSLIAAVVVLLIGIIVAWAVKTIITKVAGYVNLKAVTETVGLNKIFQGKVDLKGLLGDVAQWIVIIIFLVPAIEIAFPVEEGTISPVRSMLEGVIAYIPNVVAAIFIILIGAVVADLVARVVNETSKTIGVKTADVLADVARYSIIVFIILAALAQLGIATELIFRLVTALGALIAIAGGLAFGLGGQDAAKDMINRLRKNLPKD